MRKGWGKAVDKSFGEKAMYEANGSIVTKSRGVGFLREDQSKHH
jgi:hypothetical protein